MQTLLYLETTTAIERIAQQIINCLFQGMTKRMYLQAKVLELMALQLAPILSTQNQLLSLKENLVLRLENICQEKEIF